MDNLLRKLKLTDGLTTELGISKNEFVTRLRENVDEGDIGFFTDMFDVFSSSKNEYKGHVSFDGFEIKRRTRFFDSSINFAIAKGTYQQKDDNNLIIDTEINGFRSGMLPFIIILALFYLVFILGFLFSGNKETGILLGFPLFIIFHATIMFSIPYFLMRRSTSRLKHDLEREFYYLTKNRNL